MQGEAQVACEGDAACLSIYDANCGGMDIWYTCRSATGSMIN